MHNLSSPNVVPNEVLSDRNVIFPLRPLRPATMASVPSARIRLKASSAFAIRVFPMRIGVGAVDFHLVKPITTVIRENRSNSSVEESFPLAISFVTGKSMLSRFFLRRIGSVATAMEYASGM
jgi:hypothetical protein